MSTFEDLVREARANRLRGWAFEYLRGRYVEGALPWSYRDRAQHLVSRASRVLDVDTGGGEFLARLDIDGRDVHAMEGFPPNVPLARERLEPRGVQVHAATGSDTSYPFPDGMFDLVLNRHGAWNAHETARVLARGGVFLSQQVGSHNHRALHQALGAPLPDGDWSAVQATGELEAAGIDVVESLQSFEAATFHDVGAVIFYLEAVPWQIEGFDVDSYDAALRRMHARFERGQQLESEIERFLILGRKNAR